MESSCDMIREEIKQSEDISIKSEELADLSSDAQRHYFEDMPGIHLVTEKSSDMFCLYCGFSFKNILIHAKAEHSNEKLIAQFLSETRSLWRRKLSFIITNYGNHLHNEHVLDIQEGALYLAEVENLNDAIYSCDVSTCPACFLWVNNLEQHTSVFCQVSNGESKEKK